MLIFGDILLKLWLILIPMNAFEHYIYWILRGNEGWDAMKKEKERPHLMLQSSCRNLEMWGKTFMLEFRYHISAIWGWY